MPSAARRRSAGRRRAAGSSNGSAGPRVDAVSNERIAIVFSSSGSLGRAPDARPLHRTLSATTSAFGREARDERLEVGRVLGLERIDEGEVEWPVQRRFALAERGQRPGVDHRDPVVGDARVPPELAGAVRPRASGSIVTIVPSSGSPSASHSVE